MENQLIHQERVAAALSLPPREKKVLANLLTLPEAYCAQLQPRSLDDVFQAPELSLSMLCNEISVAGVRAVLSIMLGNVVLFFNVGKTMNVQQIAMTCDLILEAFPYFKLEDLALCFKKGMLLEYGKLYDRMDGAVIIEWLRKYAASRDEYASVLSEAKAAEDRREEAENCYYGDYLMNLKARAEGGDEAAAGHLEAHLSLQSLLKRDREGYLNYVKDREYRRLHGR